MRAANVFKTTTNTDAPLDASTGSESKATVSDFLTMQSLTNFATTTGAITVAWQALQTLNAAVFAALWVPYAFAAFFGVVSVIISLEGLKRNGQWDNGTVLGAIFVAFINSLVLASAVVGTRIVILPAP